MEFRADFLQSKAGTHDEDGSFGNISSIDLSLAVFALPVVEKISYENRPRVCLKCYLACHTVRYCNLCKLLQADPYCGSWTVAKKQNLMMNECL